MDYKPMMCLTEFDVESAIKTWREDGYEDGYNEGIAEGLTAGERKKAVEAAVTLITDFKIDPKLAAEKMNAPLDSVLEALKSRT